MPRAKRVPPGPRRPRPVLLSAAPEAAAVPARVRSAPKVPWRAYAISCGRAIPIVASSDPVWATLPLGAAGSAEVTLGLDGDGKPFAAQPLESAAPAHLRRLVQKTLAVMSGGRFGVPPSDAPAAEQKLRIAIA